MKKIKIVLILTLLFASCSDNLTNSKAEDIIRECLEKNPQFGKVDFKTGEIMFNTEVKYRQKLLEQYKNLASKGYISLDLKKSSKKYITYNVSLTDKAKDFVLETGKLSGIGLGDITVIKIYDYELHEVKNVREETLKSITGDLTSTRAKVTLTYKKINKTPFYDSKKQLSDFINEKTIFHKTESDGWKWRYCE